MTDNRATDKLRKLLDERGVKWVTYGNTDRVWWTAENGPTWYAQDRPSAIDLFVKLETVCKPEQAIAATLGGQPARLTAEQVRKAMKKYAHDDSCYIFEVYGEMCGAIADELNAALGRGTCEWILEHSGTLYDKWRCSKCGYLYVESRVDHGIKDDFEPNYCPKCGCEVER